LTRITTLRLLIATPSNISYNYEPFNDNVKANGSFRSAADPMGLTYKDSYLLFSTNQGGFHYSRNLSDWDFCTASFQRFPTDDDQCAPAAYVVGDTLFYTGSTISVCRCGTLSIRGLAVGGRL
jgi:xylan 1,4-beta-xylosidase